jgi:hypothetical protein
MLTVEMRLIRFQNRQYERRFERRMAAEALLESRPAPPKYVPKNPHCPGVLAFQVLGGTVWGRR